MFLSMCLQEGHWESLDLKINHEIKKAAYNVLPHQYLKWIAVKYILLNSLYTIGPECVISIYFFLRPLHHIIRCSITVNWYFSCFSQVYEFMESRLVFDSRLGTAQVECTSIKKVPDSEIFFNSILIQTEKHYVWSSKLLKFCEVTLFHIYFINSVLRSV